MVNVQYFSYDAKLPANEQVVGFVDVNLICQNIIATCPCCTNYQPCNINNFPK